MLLSCRKQNNFNSNMEPTSSLCKLQVCDGQLLNQWITCNSCNSTFVALVSGNLDVSFFSPHRPPTVKKKKEKRKERDLIFHNLYNNHPCWCSFLDLHDVQTQNSKISFPTCSWWASNLDRLHFHIPQLVHHDQVECCCMQVHRRHLCGKTERNCGWHPWLLRLDQLKPRLLGGQTRCRTWYP